VSQSYHFKFNKAFDNPIGNSLIPSCTELVGREVGKLVLTEPAAPVRGLDVLHVPAVHLEPAPPLSQAPNRSVMNLTEPFQSVSRVSG
jgi:hypothetical protein